MAATWRDRTRAASSIVSPRPRWVVCGVDDQRVTAELGDADREGDPGPQRRLVEQHGDRPRAGQRLVPEPVLLHLIGQVEDRGLLGGGQVVVAQEVPGHQLPPGRGWRARRRGIRLASARVRISGGASRTASGWTALTRNPARRAAASTSAATVVGQHHGQPEPAAAHAGHQRVADRLQARRQVLAHRRGVGQQPVALDRVEHGESRGAGHRVAAERRAVVAPGEAGARPRRGRCRHRWAARRRAPWPA